MPGTNLTRDEARERSALVAVDSYVVELDLTTSERTFQVVSTIRFSCAQPGSGTFVDFVGDSVESVTLNGQTVETAYEDSRIHLTDLAADNELRVEATARYTNTGEGLHRFVDPADGEVYLYSQFEVPDSRRMYPVFEQPDLKASFTFVVTAPAHWQVVSCAPTPEPVPAGEGVATWHFPPTQRQSSYITALVAGPYDVVRDTLTGRGGEVPLGIFCRRSLTPHLDADNLFELTKQGFAFFEEEFDCAYPFEKYDQIFTPEYNMGAMENVGCVTFNEVYLFRSKVTEAIVERRALTVLHELAHMWFGNLVTMRWWNDLWLNESFAEWASTTAQAEATRWSTAWATFQTYEKDWAYTEDQQSSTHPVVAEIRDLRDVEVNFDGITYAKGASVLKQLVAYVGRDAFREGLRGYFRRHAWGNTTLDDLLTELEATSGRDLRAWSRAWLETAGVNTLTARVEVDDAGRYTRVAIEQTAPESHPTLRPHRIALGLYSHEGDRLVRTDQVELDVDGPLTEVPELVGRTQPELLLLNDDDLGYCKIRFDERSLRTALHDARGFGDALPRALVLAMAWDLTRDAEMGAREYVSTALDAIADGGSSSMLRTLLGHLHVAVFRYTAPEHREQTRRDTLARLWELARKSEPGSDTQLQLVTTACAFTTTGDDTAYVSGLLDGTQVLDGLAVDTDMRWTLLTALVAAGAAGDAEVDAELARDVTATGQERAARARAAAPTPEAKAHAWRVAVEEDGLSNSIVEAYGLGFGRSGDTAALEPYVERWHAVLDTVESKGSHALVEAIVEGFYPRALASAELRDASDRWLQEHPDAPAALRRLVVEQRDPVARAVAAQERDALDPA